MTAGKGNFKTEQMINAFLENKLKDDALEMNNLRLSIRNNVSDFRDTKNFLKPLEDMVDSYWVLRSLK